MFQNDLDVFQQKFVDFSQVSNWNFHNKLLQLQNKKKSSHHHLLTLTFLLFLPVLSVLLPLELFVYLHLIIGTLFLCISAHLTVLLLSNPVLNLIFLLLPITSSHSHTSASDSTFGFWRYINISFTMSSSKFIIIMVSREVKEQGSPTH